VKTDVLERLWAVIEDRKRNRIDGSYTCRMLDDRKRLEEKLAEECSELLKSKKKTGKDSVTWEAADLLYHMMVYLSLRDVGFDEVLEELEGRMK
jgi:phosphoribosyl-ATP pyrophosphohydrolase